MPNGTHSAVTLYVRDSEVFRPATSQEMLEAAHRAIAQRFKRGRVLSSPTLVREYLRIAFASLEYEVFCLLLLDSRHHLLALHELFRGTIDSAPVFPREVVKETLRHNAAAVILAHNHPSGVAEPSPADELITRRIQDALALVNVRVLDHLVVAGDCVVSMSERGLV
jgi:DNA repair protein RadC